MTQNGNLKQVEVPFLKTDPGVQAPFYATLGAAAFDIASNVDASVTYGEPVVIPTGLKMAIPEDHVLLIYSRSGHGFKNNIRLANSVGVIDSDYRGEIFIKLTMDFPSWQTTYEIKKGDRIAQGMVIPIPRTVFREVTELSSTERGENGGGSTGVA